MSTEDIFANPVPHHISDVDTWGHADRNYFVFVALTFLFGFVGLDHMYLRSNETAFKKLVLNVCGLGIWYVWDIIQVLKDGPVVRKHGLNSPFDWIRGIGRGMFVPLPMDKEAKNNAPKTGGGDVGNAGNGANKVEYAAPKDYFLYTLLAVFLGIFGADKFYLGSNWQGLAKLFSVFNIFLFLFGILWVLWDAVHAYFMTKSVLEKGVAPPMPFSWFFSPIDSNIFKVQEVKEEKEESGFLSRLPIPSLPVMPWKAIYNELVVPLLQPTVGNTINNASKVVSIGTKAAGLATTALAAAPGFVGNVGQEMEAAAMQQANQIARGTTVDAVQAAAQSTAAQRQTGGAKDNQGGPGPIIAGALTAILIAGGLKGFYDFLSKQVN